MTNPVVADALIVPSTRRMYTQDNTHAVGIYRQAVEVRMVGVGVIRALLVPAIFFAPLAAKPQDFSDFNRTLSAESMAEREGRLLDAKTILANAIQTAEQTTPNGMQLAVYLRRLGSLYAREQQYSDAMALAQRAMEIDRKASGPYADGRVANDMATIASFLQMQKKNDEAEQLWKQALEIARQNPRTNPAITAGIVNNLTSLYQQEHRFEEAELLAQEAVSTCDASPPNREPCLMLRRALSSVYQAEGKRSEAEQLDANAADLNRSIPAELARLDQLSRQYERDERWLQAELTHRSEINWIEQNPKAHEESRLPSEYDALGGALERQNRNDQAETAYKTAIALQEGSANPKQPESAFSFALDSLINLYRKEERLADAEPIIQRALEVQERILGQESPRVADTLITLAGIEREEGRTQQVKYREAANLYARALAIQEKNMGPDHPRLVPLLAGYADALRELHDDTNAAQIRARIATIQKKIAEGALKSSR